jgi:hypothetical protein
MTNKQIVDIKLKIERHTNTTTKRVNSCALVRGQVPAPLLATVILLLNDTNII